MRLPHPGFVLSLGLLVAASDPASARAAAAEPPPFNNAGQPNRSQNGPWNNDVLVFRVPADGAAERLATFPRAGVPTAARLADGRLIAAHQHFPADDDAAFDKVAVHFSSDEGRTWTSPAVIELEGLPAGMRFPFDPTLVPLPDGRIRLYFTSLRGRQFEEDRPAIHSAVSRDGLSYVYEAGVRFEVAGRPVIDCAVVLHQGIFHLFAPDNGAGANPGAPNRRPEDLPSAGTAYHATSQDGLAFTREPDLRIEGSRRWLGNAQSDGPLIRFFGSGGPRGLWSATSRDGAMWTLENSLPQVMGADPGAVALQDGAWLLVVTGPPRQGAPPDNPAGNPGPGARTPVVNALDANGDGTIDPQEISNAPAALRRLDRNNDGRINPEELRPAPPPAGPNNGNR